jgi:hypothetical protein
VSLKLEIEKSPISPDRFADVVLYTEFCGSKTRIVLTDAVLSGEAYAYRRGFEKALEMVRQGVVKP